MRTSRVLVLRLQKLSQTNALQYLNACSPAEISALAAYLHVSEAKIGARIQRCIEKLFPTTAAPSSEAAPSAVYQSKLFDEPLFEESKETNQ